jgi:hypothetical protein
MDEKMLLKILLITNRKDAKNGKTQDEMET